MIHIRYILHSLDVKLQPPHCNNLHTIILITSQLSSSLFSQSARNLLAYQFYDEWFLFQTFRSFKVADHFPPTCKDRRNPGNDPTTAFWRSQSRARTRCTHWKHTHWTHTHARARTHARTTHDTPSGPSRALKSRYIQSFAKPVARKKKIKENKQEVRYDGYRV